MDGFANNLSKEAQYSKFLRPDYCRAENISTVLPRDIPKHYEHLFPEENTKLHLASIRGNLAQVVFCLDVLRYDPNSANLQGNTALQLAAQAGQKEVAVHLAQNSDTVYLAQNSDTDVSEFEDSGYSPLHFAALNGDHELVNFFVTELTIEPLSGNALTPLHCACFSGNPKVACLLIEEAQKYHPIDLNNVTTSSGDTLLHYAAFSESVELTKYLLEKCKMKFVCMNRNGVQPFHLAVHSGCKNIVSFYMDQPDIKIDQLVESTGQNALHIAASQSHFDVAEQLVSRGEIDPFAKDLFGCTPLHYAALSGSLKIFQLLMSLTSSRIDLVQITDHHEHTIFHFAVRSGNLAFVRFLTKYQKAVVFCKDKKGWGALHHAVDTSGSKLPQFFSNGNNCMQNSEDNQFEIVRYLVTEMKCDPQAKTLDGQTLLHISCNLRIIVYLTSKVSIDPNSCDSKGMIALHYACLAGKEPIVRYLLDECGCNQSCLDGNRSSVMHYACCSGNIGLLKFLVTERKCDPIQSNKNGATPLYYSVIHGHLSVLQFYKGHLNLDLTSFGTFKHGHQLNLLHCACINGHLTIVKYLLEECNFDKSTTAFSGLSILHYASKHKDVLEYLIVKQHCDPCSVDIIGNTVLHCTSNLDSFKYLLRFISCYSNKQNSHGFTPLHSACQQGELNIVQFLINECKANPSQKSFSGVMPIHLAAQSCSINILKFLVMHGCDPSCKDNNGDTILHFCCTPPHPFFKTESRCLKATEFVVKNPDFNCNPESLNNKSQTPLHLACLYGYANVVKFLVEECQCDLYVKDNREQTPLHVACRYGNTEIVEFIFKHGNQNDKKEWALHIACMYGQYNLVKHLVENCKLDVLATDTSGKVPIWYACDHLHKEIMVYLAKQMLTNYEGRTIVKQVEARKNFDIPIILSISLLNIACKQGNLDIVKLLFSDQSSLDQFHQNSLHYAAAGCQTEVVQYLLQEGCDPMCKNILGNTPLHCCVVGELNIGSIHFNPLEYYSEDLQSDKRKEVAHMLIQKNKRLLNMQNTNGATVLHMACKKGFLCFVEFLNEVCKCDMTIRDYSGRTCLHDAAALQGKFHLLEYLVEQECDPLAEDENGCVPLHCCVDDCPEMPTKLHCILQLTFFSCILFSLRSPPEVELLNPLDTNKTCTDLFQSLLFLKLKCDVNTPKRSGATILHYACQKQSKEVVAFLLEKCGCDKTIRDYKGRTALHYAAIGWKVDTVQYLIEKHGFDVLVTDNNGNTPLHSCCNGSNELQIDGFRFLPASIKSQLLLITSLAKECTINLANHSNMTALHFACKQLSENLVRHLIEKCGFDVKIKGDRNKTCLHYAAINADIDIIRYLILDQGCDPSITDEDGNIPLHYCVEEALRNRMKTQEGSFQNIFQQIHACSKLILGIHFPFPLVSYRNYLASIKFLALRSNFNTLNDSSLISLLYLACKEDVMIIVKSLIEKRECDFSGVCASGQTAFHVASEKGHLTIIKYLIGQGCNPLLRDENGNTAVHLAALNGHLSILKHYREQQSCDFKFLNSKGETPLHSACQGGNLSNIQYLIEECAVKINSKDKNGNTPIHKAVLNGHLSVIEYLIKKGCDIQTRNVHGSTAIHLAIINSQLSTLCYLKEQLNCDPNTTNSKGQTPIHYACHQGEMSIVQYLVDECEVDINGKTKEGYMPFLLAALNGHLPVVKYLIKHGCNFLGKENYGNTAIHLAAFNNHLSVMRYLKEQLNCDPSALNNDEEMPIHLACRKGNIGMVEYLVEECAVYIDHRNKYGSTPFLIAVMNGHLTVIKYLIKKGCDIKTRNVHGNTAIHLAILNNKMSTLCYLKEQLNCDPNTTNDEGQAPIHHACLEGEMRIVQYLVEECEVDINIKTKEGCTPFLIAALNGCLTAIEYLLKKGSNTQARDVCGNTPAHLAALSGDLSTIQYFKEQLNSDFNTANHKGELPLHYACKKGNIEVIQYLIGKCTVDITPKDKEENTPLAFAAMNGHLALVQYLIKQGCDPLKENIYGNTAVHLAAWNGHLSIIQYLKKLDCNLSTTNKQGQTPIHFACQEGRTDIVQYLIEECAIDRNCIDIEENTPLLSAAMNGQIAVIEYLIKQGSDPLQQNIYGHTLAHCAALKGHLSAMKYFTGLDNSGRLTLTSNCFGEMPLHSACRAGIKEAMQYLVEECKMSVNTKSNVGLTPLHYAAFNGRLDIVEYLIDQLKANAMCVDNHGNSPAHYAAFNANTKINTIILQVSLRASSIRSTLDCHNLIIKSFMCLSLTASDPEKLAVVKFLASPKVNCDLSAKNNEGCAILHIAAQSGYLSIIKYLIQELKLEIFSYTKCGCTPLDIARVYHNQEVVEFLQQHTTSTHSPPSVIHLSALLGHISSMQHYITDLQHDPDLRDSIGRTPLYYAAMGGHLIITQYLVSSNADPLSEDVFHNLPLHYAAALGHLDVVQFLVNIGSPLTARGVWDKTPAEMAAAGGHRNVLDYLNSLQDDDGLDWVREV